VKGLYTQIKAKGIIDGTSREIIQNGSLLVQNGKIKKVLKTAVEAGHYKIDEVLDFSDSFIMPGLIDAHSHLSIVPGEGNQLAQMRLPASINALRSIPNIQKNIASGVTTMRILGEEHFVDIDIKNAINNGTIEGPRLLVSGKGLVPSNGHGVAWTTTDGEVEMRKNARLNLAKGADLIKLFVTGGISSTNTSLDYCSYSRKEIATAVEEAERAGTYVAAHAHGGKGIDLCIEEGVRTIEHAAFITEQQLERVVEKDLWIIGTFSILFHKTGIEQSDFSVPEIREKVLRARETVADTFSKVLKYKPNLSLGTDSMHGLISYEAECLVKFGASNAQAVAAITRDAAKACRIEDQTGTLEEGKFADFIVLKNNPLDNIKHLQNINYVFKEGKLLHRAEDQVNTKLYSTPL
jgi:imidazolonepropionase-like amidohydrolase